ncbi:zinc finger protein 488-like [Choloepus didactylus]|uniref:zinc finger protein 488-like n=1 Tax=Choloepus didactylus TaxID=27675 RepID=UPI00189CF75D|nr:zinc finger protein 488-like [Choloepus didactylus]
MGLLDPGAPGGPAPEAESRGKPRPGRPPSRVPNWRRRLLGAVRRPGLQTRALRTAGPRTGSAPKSPAPPWYKPSGAPEPCSGHCWKALLALLAKDLLEEIAAEKVAPLRPVAETRWQLGEPQPGRVHELVLLEKTNCPDSKAAMGTRAELALSAAPGKHKLSKAHREQRQSAFTEVQRLRERLGGDHSLECKHGDPAVQPGLQQLAQDIPWSPAGHVVFSGWPSRVQDKQRSAFSKPKCPAEIPGPAPVFPAREPVGSPGNLSRLTNTVEIPYWSQLSHSKLWVSGFWNLQMLPQNASLSSAFLGGSMLGLKHTVVQIPMPLSSTPTSSLTLLPPTFTSLGLSTHNWCAKCRLSFQLTSDLVFHMRSHHKKECAGPEPHSVKQREEALMCPTCHEYFRECHHLSRHTTSHT